MKLKSREEFGKGVLCHHVNSTFILKIFLGKTMMWKVFRIGGININNLRFADDTALIADKVENLQKNLDIINQVGKEHFNTKMNTLKTKVMVVSKQGNARQIKVKLDGHQLEQVDKFTYLGQTITNDGRCEEEIKKRITIAKKQFSLMKNVLTNRKLRCATRKRLVKCYIWTTLLFGSRNLDDKQEL